MEGFQSADRGGGGAGAGAAGRQDPDDDPKNWTSYTNRQIRAVYVADGFQEDCIMILKKYSETDSLRFEDFCRVWKSTKFSYVFHGRRYDVELAELSEEFMFIAKKFVVEPGSTFKERVGALYLLYAMFYMQPIQKFASTYITPADTEILLQIEKDARSGRHFDVLYVLGRILMDGGTHYQLADRMYGLEEEVRRNMEGQVSVERLTAQPGGMASCQEELTLLRELSSICRRYKMLKKATQEAMGRPDRNLEYVNDHLDSELAASFSLLMKTGKYKAPEEVNSEKKGEDRSDMIAKIKDKAMCNQVQKSQHLMDEQELNRKKNREKRNKRNIEGSSESSDDGDENRSAISTRTLKAKKKQTNRTAPTPTKNKGSPSKIKKTLTKNYPEVSMRTAARLAPSKEGANDSFEIIPPPNNPVVIVDDSQSQSLGLIDEPSTSVDVDTSENVSQVGDVIAKGAEIALTSKEISTTSENVKQNECSKINTAVVRRMPKMKQRVRVKDVQVDEDKIKKIMKAKQVLSVPQELVPPILKPSKTYKKRRVSGRSALKTVGREE